MSAYERKQFDEATEAELADRRFKMMRYMLLVLGDMEVERIKRGRRNRRKASVMPLKRGRPRKD